MSQRGDCTGGEGAKEGPVPESQPGSAHLSQVSVQLQVTVLRPGRYALLLEYANEDSRQEASVAVHTPQQASQLGMVTFHPCMYRWI